MNRRGFLGAMLGAMAAPAIVRAESLMRIVVPSKELIVPGKDIWHFVGDAEWNYEPGQMASHDWYAGPFGARLDRAIIPSVLVDYMQVYKAPANSLILQR